MIHVVHAVASDGFAGVERFVTRLAGAQARAGHRVLVCGGPPARMRAELPDGVDYRPAGGVLGVARVLARHRADVVNVHMTATELAALLGHLARAARGWRPVPVVATRHFALVRAVGSGRLGPPLARAISPQITAQIAVSRFVAAAIDGPSTVVLPGVPDGDGPVDAGLREPVVLLAQRLEPEKHTDEALRVFARSGLADRGWQLHVAGGGSERRGLVELGCRLGIASSVRFLGFRSDVDELLARAGVLLAPNPGEHLGLSVLEAMAAGLPVVAAGAAGHLETLGLVPEARLHPPGDVDTAAGLLSDLAGDPDARTAYATAQRALQRERFSLDRQVAETDAVYRRVLGAGS